MIVKEVTLAVIRAVNMQELSFWRTDGKGSDSSWCSLLIEFEFVTLYSTPEKSSSETDHLPVRIGTPQPVS